MLLVVVLQKARYLPIAFVAAPQILLEELIIGVRAENVDGGMAGGDDRPAGGVAFLEDVRTITPFNFRIPKLGVTKQVRCTGYSIEHTSFDTVTINMSVETDYTLG